MMKSKRIPASLCRASAQSEMRLNVDRFVRFTGVLGTRAIIIAIGLIRL